MNAVKARVLADICWNFSLEAYLSNNSPMMSEKQRINEYRNSPNTT